MVITVLANRELTRAKSLSNKSQYDSDDDTEEESIPDKVYHLSFNRGTTNNN